MTNPLKLGDKIAIISPAGVVNPEYIEGACQKLKTWGYEPVVGKNALNIYGRYAGTTKERAADLQWALDDEEIKAILCSRGGYGVMQIIENINFEKFKKNPKWLIGFSDITILHSVIFHLNIPSIHGIMAKHIAEKDEDSLPVAALKKLLQGENPKYNIPVHSLNITGIAEGVLVGGNLSVFYGLRATKWDIQPKGKILFLEDLAEKPYHIDRMMQNLKLSGVLQNISGLIIGQFTEIEEDPLMFKTVYEIIADAVKDYGYPVCFNFPAGHVEENYPLILGEKIKLEVNGQTSMVNY
jgi:muramoyltetrapeptide carboxypeptidase